MPDINGTQPYPGATMKFGVDVPTHSRYADPGLLLEMAIEAEEAGWDGFF